MNPAHTDEVEQVQARLRAVGLYAPRPTEWEAERDAYFQRRRQRQHEPDHDFPCCESDGQ